MESADRYLDSRRLFARRLDRHSRQRFRDPLEEGRSRVPAHPGSALGWLGTTSPHSSVDPQTVDPGSAELSCRRAVEPQSRPGSRKVDVPGRHRLPAWSTWCPSARYSQLAMKARARQLRLAPPGPLPTSRGQPGRGTRCWPRCASGSPGGSASAVSPMTLRRHSRSRRKRPAPRETGAREPDQLAIRPRVHLHRHRLIHRWTRGCCAAGSSSRRERRLGDPLRTVVLVGQPPGAELPQEKPSG